MSTVDKVATLAATKYAGLSGNAQAALDPATILAFAELALKVVQMFKDCKASPNAALKTAKNPGLFARMRLRNLVRDSMSKKDFKDHGPNIVQALLSSGPEVTLETLTALYNEV